MSDADRFVLIGSMLAGEIDGAEASQRMRESLIAEGQRAFTFRESEQQRAALQIEMLGELDAMRGSAHRNDQHRALAGSEPPGELVVLWFAAVSAFAYQKEGCMPTNTLIRLLEIGRTVVSDKKGNQSETILSEGHFADRISRYDWRR